MKVRNALLATALIFSCLGAKSQDETFTLIWKPKTGQAITYGMTMDATAGGDKSTFMFDINLKVTKVADNGDYTIETVQKNARVVAGGEEHKLPDPDDAKPTVETFNAKGEKISEDKKKAEEEEADETSALLESVGDFKAPDKAVKKGDTWTEVIKADEKKKIKAAKVKYEVVGREKVLGFDALTVSMTYTQSEGSKPATYDGTMSFDVSDMSLVRLSASLHDVAGPDANTPGEIKLKMERN